MEELIPWCFDNMLEYKALIMFMDSTEENMVKLVGNTLARRVVRYFVGKRSLGLELRPVRM